MADRGALRNVGLIFGALTIAVTLMGAGVVKQHIDGQPTVNVAESPAVDVDAAH